MNPIGTGSRPPDRTLHRLCAGIQRVRARAIFGFITPMEGYPEFSVPTLETCVIDSPSRVRRTLTLLLAQAV